MDAAEKTRMEARLAELGEEQVKLLAAQDGFPHTWRVGVAEWLRDRQAQARERKPQE